MTEDDLTTASARAVEHAITSRRAIRAFLPTPVDPVLVRRLIAVAARAPSGTNMQPWNFNVLWR
jgi:nitroreductase